ncbi:MAG TPA: hypothetical protein PKH80_04880 [Methanofastidiosum sp.]|nr:hypothetical protein [Methanofastidiosum sp.]HNU62050.1 hypothetical protein [Methanofastidiosum sp.]
MNKKMIVLVLLALLLTVNLGCISRNYTSTSVSNPVIIPVQEKIPEISQNEAPQSIHWNQAKYHIGETITVYGNVVSTLYASSSNGKPTFLNIGRDYPDQNRFTVVIWGRCRPNFSVSPEIYYRGKTIYVTGVITEYNGAAQIEVCYPNQIQQ